MPEAASKDERTWEMFCHLSALLGLFTVNLGSILGPLIVWLIKKDEMPGVDRHGKESLNFQISMFIYMAVSAILIIVAVGLVLVPILAIVNIVCVIIATIKANNGEFYQYPITIRFLK